MSNAKQLLICLLMIHTLHTCCGRAYSRLFPFSKDYDRGYRRLRKFSDNDPTYYGGSFSSNNGGYPSYSPYGSDGDIDCSNNGGISSYNGGNNYGGYNYGGYGGSYGSSNREGTWDGWYENSACDCTTNTKEIINYCIPSLCGDACRNRGQKTYEHQTKNVKCDENECSKDGSVSPSEYGTWDAWLEYEPCDCDVKKTKKMIRYCIHSANAKFQDCKGSLIFSFGKTYLTTTYKYQQVRRAHCTDQECPATAQKKENKNVKKDYYDTPRSQTKRERLYDAVRSQIKRERRYGRKDYMV